MMPSYLVQYLMWRIKQRKVTVELMMTVLLSTNIEPDSYNLLRKAMHLPKL